MKCMKATHTPSCDSHSEHTFGGASACCQCDAEFAICIARNINHINPKFAGIGDEEIEESTVDVKEEEELQESSPQSDELELDDEISECPKTFECANCLACLERYPTWLCVHTTGYLTKPKCPSECQACDIRLMSLQLDDHPNEYYNNETLLHHENNNEADNGQLEITSSNDDIHELKTESGHRYPNDKTSLNGLEYLKWLRSNLNMTTLPEVDSKINSYQDDFVSTIFDKKEPNNMEILSADDTSANKVPLEDESIDVQVEGDVNSVPTEDDAIEAISTGVKEEIDEEMEPADEVVRHRKHRKHVHQHKKENSEPNSHEDDTSLIDNGNVMGNADVPTSALPKDDIDVPENHDPTDTIDTETASEDIDSLKQESNRSESSSHQRQASEDNKNNHAHLHPRQHVHEHKKNTSSEIQPTEHQVRSFHEVRSNNDTTLSNQADDGLQMNILTQNIPSNQISVVERATDDTQQIGSDEDDVSKKNAQAIAVALLISLMLVVIAIIAVFMYRKRRRRSHFISQDFSKMHDTVRQRAGGLYVFDDIAAPNAMAGNSNNGAGSLPLVS